jgi:VWFA-related protein
MRLALVLICLVPSTFAATKLSVSVVERRTGLFVGGLKAADFTILEDKNSLRVESVEITPAGPLDVMLLLDTSLVGPAVQPFAASLIGQLQDKDQMAVIGYHSSADLVQDFTSSKELLSKAVATVKFGNTPRVLDALSACIREGFDNAIYRRVVLLLTTGYDGGSRETERDVVRLARRNGVSIYPIYMAGAERGMFETLARETGGAIFSLNDLRKNAAGQPGPRIFETVRQTYIVTVTGNLSLGDKVKVEIRTPQKVFASILPLE